MSKLKHTPGPFKARMKVDLEKRRIQAVCRHLKGAQMFLEKMAKDMPEQSALYYGLLHQIAPIHNRAMERMLDLIQRQP